MTPLACVMCAMDPQTTSLVVPVAQAAVITVPIFFRGQIAAAVRRARKRVRPDASPDATVSIDETRPR